MTSFMEFMKKLFWKENLRFLNFCRPLEGFAPPGSFPSYATAIAWTEREFLVSHVSVDMLASKVVVLVRETTGYKDDVNVVDRLV